MLTAEAWILVEPRYLSYTATIYQQLSRDWQCRDLCLPFCWLSVSLPPEKVPDTGSSKLFTMDQCCNKKLNELETTTDDNKTLNVEVSSQQKRPPLFYHLFNWLLYYLVNS